MPKGVYKRTKPVWNKGLTKKDKRVEKYSLSEGSKKNQFKKGDKKFGEKNGNWKGGIIFSCDGYVLIKQLKHPRARTNRGYIFEHILVMEEHLGRFLEKDEVVHHINEIKDDNRIENLRLMTNSNHITFHNIQRFLKLKGELIKNVN